MRSWLNTLGSYFQPVTAPYCTESNFPNLAISAINVNSFNIASYKEGGCKTHEKLVAIMRRNSDFIIMTDCRLKGGVEKVRKILRIGKGTQYDLIANSTKSERGVCIAYNRGRDIEILAEDRDTNDENFLLLKCKIEGKEVVIGGVYGPNVNNVNYYTNLKRRVESYGLPFFLGGDFNTVLNGAQGEENLDLEDRLNIPNKDNGKFLREWIEEGTICDPFRKKYPLSRCMSYVPFRKRKRVNNVWVDTNYGKSRLDFFLMSCDIFQEVESVFYGERISKDMDHLEVVMRLGKSVRKKGSILLRNITLERPEAQEISVLGYLDCLNTHLVHRNAEIQYVVESLQNIYIEKCNIRGEIELNGESELLTDRLAILEGRWIGTLRNLGPLEDLNELDLQFTHTTFYEVLLNEFKNRLIALQGNIDSRKVYKRKWLAKKLEVFKRLFPLDSVQVKQCEDDILEYDSLELKIETDKYLEFLRANNEKPTRGFCNLGKNVGTVDDIEQILDKDGNAFTNPADREKHITGFYRNLYSKKIDRIIEIENFFSQEELDRINGRGQKIPAEVREGLEGVITCEEIEKSLKNSNFASCPGWDGVSYKFIKTMWDSLKVPITKMANEGFNQGFLSPTLRTGLIKLIPKGKNNTRVEDWRPITLLTSSYKVISGVISSRLETALPYIIGRGQKGFLKYKNMGTCIQNVVDGIADSWANREQMGTLMIDFVKAFDSIEHEFVSKSMKFFGFGPVLCNMVRTLLKDRRACIDLNSCHGSYFEIARGAPQGDRASPYIFIICIEILILKLESDESNLIQGRERSVPLRNRGENFWNQLLEAFADDLTVLFKWSINALGRIIVILNEFGAMSGLNINKSKTNLMISGIEWEGGEEALGIKIVKQCKLLGIKIDYKAKELDTNWVECCRKVWGLIYYWNQFRLTLTGRVMVAKTFLMSQTTFYMGVIPANKNKLSEIEDAIGKYVCGNLKIAKDRWHNRPEQGGLGLIKLDELDTAIKCGWVNRWVKEGIVKRDITGRSVLGLARTSAELLDFRRIQNSKLPCAISIAQAWCNFRKKYYENESNIHVYDVKFFFNPAVLGIVGQQLESTIFHGDRAATKRDALLQIKLSSLLNDTGSVKEKVDIEGLIPGFSRSEYLRLKTEVNWLLRKYKPRLEMKPSAKNIMVFLSEIKKGSRKFRGKISGRGSIIYREFKFDGIRPIQTLWGHLDLIPDANILSIGSTLWKISSLDIGFREFLFKMNQGLVHGNTVVSHFANVNRKCTFCKIKTLAELRRHLGREPDQIEENVATNGFSDENRAHIFGTAVLSRNA
jgi:hypothetical protein